MKELQYEIIDHGYDHSQYFQGCGTYGTPYRYVTTGVGMDAKEAYEDAREQVYMHDEKYGDMLPKRPRGINAKNKVPARLAAEEENEIYYYVSIRYGREE